MKTEEIYCNLFDFSRPTYYKYKREGNLAFALISKYISDDEIVEFMDKGYIARLETFDEYRIDPVFERQTMQNFNRVFQDDEMMQKDLEFLVEILEDKSYFNLDIKKITPVNAKDDFESQMQEAGRIKLKGFVFTLKSFNAMTDFELYLILKYPDKYLPEKVKSEISGTHFIKKEI